MVQLTSEGVRREKNLQPLAGTELRTFQVVSYSLYQLMQPGFLSKVIFSHCAIRRGDAQANKQTNKSTAYQS